MNVFVGIDPGARGAIAFICRDAVAPTVINVFDYENQAGFMFLREIANAGFHDIHAMLEKVNAMPHQGVVSMFKFGQNFGEWQGWLKALQIPFDFVTPQRWRNAVMDSAMKVENTKAQSLDRARRLYPQMGEYLKLQKHDGRAEALLMARFCEMVYAGGDKDVLE